MKLNLKVSCTACDRRKIFNAAEISTLVVLDKKYNHSNYDTFETSFHFPFLFWQRWIIDRFSHWSGAIEQVHWGKWVTATFIRNKRKLCLWLSCAVLGYREQERKEKSFTLILISINNEMFEISSLEIWQLFLFHLRLMNLSSLATKTATCIANIEPVRHGDSSFQNRVQSEFQSCDKSPKVRSGKEYSKILFCLKNREMLFKTNSYFLYTACFNHYYS